MANGNGKLTLKEFKEADDGTRLYYIWERLNNISELSKRVNKIENWQKQMIGAMIVLNVVVLPLIILFINKIT